MKVDDSQGNMITCMEFCGECPSYPQTGEGLFCARGVSESEITKKGCRCNRCGIFENYTLSGSYFCIEGAVE
ncbi:MAG: DUF2769 domain-containing protein [Candidatus Hydrothermarchaeaceae archaeon]